MATECMEERLEKLERTTRRYRLVLAGLSMAILATGVIWVVMVTTSRALAQKTGEARKIIRASQFDLVDENGKDHGGLCVTKDGTALLVLMDENGMTRFQVYVTNEGPVLNLVDENGQKRVALGPGKTEQAGKLTTYTESSLRLIDRGGSVIWSAP